MLRNDNNSSSPGTEDIVQRSLFLFRHLCLTKEELTSLLSMGGLFFRRSPIGIRRRCMLFRKNMHPRQSCCRCCCRRRSRRRPCLLCHCTLAATTTAVIPSSSSSVVLHVTMCSHDIRCCRCCWRYPLHRPSAPRTTVASLSG